MFEWGEIFLNYKRFFLPKSNLPKENYIFAAD